MVEQTINGRSSAWVRLLDIRVVLGEFLVYCTSKG